jgi:carbon-monoxide dehydrogenase iron sulfur subunit
MKEIFVRLDRCVGCHACELACVLEHSAAKHLFAAIAERPVPRKRLYVEYVLERKLPLLCRHCEDAPCVRACRTAAMSQDALTRIVTHDPDKCIGCWMCTMVCPYGVVGRQLERRIAVKCDRCPDLEVPACVTGCPTRALVYAEEEEFSKGVRRVAGAEVAEGYITAQTV